METKWGRFKRKTKAAFRRFVQNVKDKFMGILFLLISGFFIWLFFDLLYMFYGFSVMEWVKGLPYVYDTFSYFFAEIKAQTDLGIFYLFMFSSLFFLPVPLEALYFNLLRQGFPYEKIFIISVLGLLAGQVINYMLGRILGFVFVHFMEEKTRMGIKRKLTKYGVFAITFVHMIPFPFQVFNFISGMLKYSFLRIVFFAALGLAIKHVAMIWIYLRFMA